MQEEKEGSMKVLRHMAIGMLVAVAAMAMLAAACGGAVSAPAATSAPAKPAAAPTVVAGSEASKPAAAGQAVTPTFQLKMTHHEPEGSKVNAVFNKWADAINQKTNGQVKIQVYPGEVLAKGTDAVSAVSTGIADIGWAIVAFFPGQFPLTEVYNLPVTGVTSSKSGGLALWDLYQSNPEMQKEWSNLKLLGFTSSGTQWISTSKKPVRTIDDVKGLKLRIAGWGGTEFLKGLNASPIAMAPPDMYESLSKGILDGIVFDWQGINSSRLYEVVSYSATMPVILQPQAVIMNPNKWKALPPDIQQVFTDYGGKWLAENAGTGAFDAADQEGLDNFKKINKEVITFSAEEKVKWQAASKPVWAAWVQNVKAKGLDGQKALDQLQEAIAKNK